MLGRRTSKLLFSQRLSAIVLTNLHPIVVDQYDVCAMVKSKAVNTLKVALLQVLCESLELQVPSPQVGRKAPYVTLLQNLVNSCTCSAIIV